VGAAVGVAELVAVLVAGAGAAIAPLLGWTIAVSVRSRTDAAQPEAVTPHTFVL
jgi:hypothetical protein